MRALLFVIGFVLVAVPASAETLRVAVTTPDLASLVTAVGGDAVEVTTFARGGQDPHFVEARPSFIRVLSRADLFVFTGLQLEIGWAPMLVRSARNSRVRPGEPGSLDASDGIPRLGVLSGEVDRSMGDVHATGNPHYLLDPVNGLRVVRALHARLTHLAPQNAKLFGERTAAFEASLLRRLVGAALVDTHSPSVVAEALLEDRLADLAAPEQVDGWLGTMRAHRGKRLVADHNLWPYFAARFGLEVVAFLEPLPGITPTTRHLGEVVLQMKRDDIHAILSAAYFHPRYAQKVAEATGATLVEMANQVGARDGVGDYLAMIDWNVRGVADAL
jgi:ABC-type Zn uptake system ZnuABC Zn-binding protein ZnuA